MRTPLPPLQLKKALMADNLITAERFDELLGEAERKDQNILDVLVSEKIASYGFLGDMVAKILGVERVDFAAKSTDRQTVQMLPEDVARQRQVIVFDREPNGTLDVAMTDPSDLETIEFLTQRFKVEIRPFLATADDLNRGFAVYGYELGQDFKKLIEENIKASLTSRAGTIEEAASQLPIVGIVDNILSYAMASRASDIHIEIFEEATLIRYRIDGILYEIMSIAKAVHPAIVARIKLLSGLKIDEHVKPQDGRFRHQIVGDIIDVRVSVMPTYFGEKVEMRLLEAAQKPLSLEELGIERETAKIISDNLGNTFGMILSCGPTGSGKTTTLYAVMNIINKPQINVVTIEDPIEYNMRYVNQTQINPQAGITFASGLRAILRQDPNVIMVGEIRDSETAEIAVQAAITGHLLLSSLHTNDALTAIPRLFDLKVQPFLVSSVLNLIIAQRLVRRICQSCVCSYDAGPEVGRIIAEQFKESGISKEVIRVPKTLYRGKGCAACGMTGYKGRLGIFEIFAVDDKIRKIMNDSDFDFDKLRAAARERGMRTIFEDGLDKAELAITTLEEVLRVVQE